MLKQFFTNFLKNPVIHHCIFNKNYRDYQILLNTIKRWSSSGALFNASKSAILPSSSVNSKPLLCQANLTRILSQANSVQQQQPSLLSSNLIVQRGVSMSTDQIRREEAWMERMHITGPKIKLRKKKTPLDGRPQLKGVVLRTLIKKPKKPNSANRKCVLVRLSNGKEMVAYVPGIGHNLQEHNIVLVRCGRLRDTPGVKIKCIRGVYDLAHVIKKDQ